LSETDVPDYADPVRHIQPHQMDDADHFIFEKAHNTPLLTTACAIYFSGHTKYQVLLPKIILSL